MAFNIDWSALTRAPNIAAAAQAGWERGQAQGALRALAMDGSNRQAFADLASVAPQTALAWDTNRRNQALLDIKTDEASRRRQALAMIPDVMAGYGVGGGSSGAVPNVLAGYQAPGGQGVLSGYTSGQPREMSGPAGTQTPNALSSLLAAQTGQTPQAGQAPASGADMVITAPQKHHSIADLYALDPEIAQGMTKQIGELADQHRKQLAGEADAMANVAYPLLQLPEAQRQAALDRQRGYLKSAGFADHELDDADLTDEGLHGYITHSLGIKAALSQHQQEAEAAEKAQHDRAMEAHDRELEANAAGDLAVSQGRLGIERQREAREAARGGGSSPVISRNLGGRTFYQVNGKWFDNAEGR